MTARIEIVAEDVEQAHAEMLRMLSGSAVYDRALKEEFRSGEYAAKWADYEAGYPPDDLIAFMNGLAALILDGKAKEFFPDRVLDVERCRQISSVLGWWLKIRQRRGS